MRRSGTVEAWRLLPVETYVSTVDALYGDGKSLFAGAATATLAAGVTAWAAQEIMFAVCAVLLALVTVARWCDVRAYHAQTPKPDTIETARRWERRYIVGSAVYVGLLTSWCLLTFALTNDPAVQLISFSVSLGYLVGVTGRNFSSDQLVTAQTVIAAIPMIAALLLQADGYYIFLAALLAPFFMSLRFISARLRSVLFDAVIATHETKLIAGRFDTALNNMPHGLCMFDADRRVVVANGRFVEMFGDPAHADLAGSDIGEILQEAARRGRIATTDPGGLIDEFSVRIDRRARSTYTLNDARDRILEATFQPMEAGGSLLLVEDITERRRAEVKIEQLASYDALTGLANRIHFRRQFEDVVSKIRRDRTFAVHFIDLDQFKKVNDTLGHPVGDALLCAVANRLRALVRNHDHIARFGGDEFVLLQPIRAGDPEQAGRMAAKIIRGLSEPYLIDDHEIVIGASVGIATAPQDGTAFDHLLKCADLALYQAKADGRGVWRTFEEDMGRRAQARRALELDIRGALANEDFEAHYQPIVDIDSGRTKVCEALLRWPHPVRGMVSPGEFIPVAEEMGLIVELGDWMVRRSCADCATWPEEVSVAVNLSPVQFSRGDVVPVVRQALDAAGLSPERLIVEITESVLLEDTSETHHTMAKLRELGVRIALDDFGTGYSSLSYLHRFPLDKLKIDRSFLSDVEIDPRTLKLLRGVARLSRDMGMTVVVEGVETAAQLDLLRRGRLANELQGYFFGKAMPAPQIAARLEDERHASSAAA